MGDVTEMRGRRQSAAGGAVAADTDGESVTIATLIAQAFGVVGAPTMTICPPDADRAGRSARHLHVVRDA